MKGDKERIERAFDEAEFVSGFEGQAEEEGFLAYAVRGADATLDLGEALFKLAVKEGFVLVELRREEVSLERIFASLTLGEAVE
jgi:hypothetical protein